MTMSVEHDKPDPLEAGAGEAGAQAEPLEDGSLEARAARVAAAVMKQPLHREILRKTLGFCQQRRALTDVEREIATYPEFKYAGQNQYRLISLLVDAGGLDRLELDDGGGVVTGEMKAGLSEDEIDDLVASYAFVTTEAGAVVFEEFDPRKRIAELLETQPEHLHAFADVLEFCTTSRTYQEIEVFLQDAGLGWSGTESDEGAVHPSYFVSTLERVGGLVWKDGWLLSDEGRALLESIRNERT
jgi:hypothetical protein